MVPKKKATPTATKSKPLPVELDEALRRARVLAMNAELPVIADVLEQLHYSALLGNTKTAEAMALAGRHATKSVVRARGDDREEMVLKETTERISRQGPRPGENADALARVLALQFLIVDDPDLVQVTASIIRPSFPPFLVQKGRVFVHQDVKHHAFPKGRPAKGASSPRRGASQCKCAKCVAGRLIRAAERALDKWQAKQAAE